MLLNGFLKAHRTLEEQQKALALLKSTDMLRQTEIATLKAKLKEQRALIQKVSDKAELNKPLPQMVVNNQ